MRDVRNHKTNGGNNERIGGKFIMVRRNIETLEAFAGVVKDMLELYYDSHHQVEIMEVNKNNGVRMLAVVIKENHKSVTPTIYLEQFFEQYRNGVDLMDICGVIVDMYEKHKDAVELDIKRIQEFHSVKDRICFKLVNKKLNREMLRHTPYVEFHDLAVVFFIVVSVKGCECGNAIIKNNLLESWGIDVQELYRLAKINTQRLFGSNIMSIESMMAELLFETADEKLAAEALEELRDSEDVLPMYVATNHQKIYGAAVIMYDNLLKDFATRIGSDFYILPSSTHEVLFVPAFAETNPRCLKETVGAVNDSGELEPEELLSENIYYYNRRADRVEIVNP